MKVFLSLKKDGKTDRRGALLSRGFSEPYVGSHRLMGRLVPGLPGILLRRPPPPTTTTPPHTLTPRHPPTPTPPIFTLWKSLLHFPLISPFSLVLTRGGPLYSPLHARSQRCDRSRAPVLVPPLLYSLLALAARLPDGSALLIYSSNQCCLSLFCTTST